MVEILNKYNTKGHKRISLLYKFEYTLRFLPTLKKLFTIFNALYSGKIPHQNGIKSTIKMIKSQEIFYYTFNQICTELYVERGN